MQTKFRQKTYLTCSSEEVDSVEADSTLVHPLLHCPDSKAPLQHSLAVQGFEFILLAAVEVPNFDVPSNNKDNKRTPPSSTNFSPS